MRWIIITFVIIGIVGSLIIFTRKPAFNQAPTGALASPSPSPITMTKSYSKPPTMQIDSSKEYTAIMSTSQGAMKIKLFTKEIPRTVNNFVFLSREKFYDGTIFHRIIKDFMIQGGDPSGDGTGGPGYSFADEPITKNYTRGIVAMANSGPDTNGSQFFIMTIDTDLPKNYVIFGELIGPDSFTTLDKIASAPVTRSPFGEMSSPTQKISISSVTIEEN